MATAEARFGCGARNWHTKVGNACKTYRPKGMPSTSTAQYKASSNSRTYLIFALDLRMQSQFQ